MQLRSDQRRRLRGHRAGGRAAQMEADHDAKESDESAGTPSPHSSHSGFSTATAFLGNPSLVDAQSHLELDAFEEVPAEDVEDSF